MERPCNAEMAALQIRADQDKAALVYGQTVPMQSLEILEGNPLGTTVHQMHLQSISAVSVHNLHVCLELRLFRENAHLGIR